jgi:hypothetical protein
MTLPTHNFDTTLVPPLMKYEYDARCSGCGAFRSRSSRVIWPICLKRRHVDARSLTHKELV